MNLVRLACIYFLITPINAVAEITVIDDSNEIFILKQPVKQIISLSPHTTELLYAAGAEEQIIATVEYSDYPEKAKQLFRIGSYESIDYEKIIELNPDLILYWKSGNPKNMIDKIKSLNFKIFNNEPRKFDDVAGSIKELGKLMGTPPIMPHYPYYYPQWSYSTYPTVEIPTVWSGAIAI